MSQQELALDKYVRAMWRAKWLILLVAIGAGMVAGFVAQRQPEQHRATAFIRIGRVWKEPIEDYIVAEKIADSPGFLKEAASKAGLNPRQAKRSVHVETVQGGSRRNRYPVLLQIAATSENEEAIPLVDAVAKAIIARHDQLFDEAMKPHLEQQTRLEQRQKEIASQPAARDLLLKLETELDNVRANNSLTNTPVTERTHLIGEPSTEVVARQSVWRPAAAASLIMAAATALIAALVARFREPYLSQKDAANS